MPYIGTARVITLILTFLTVGMIRRGPKLHYAPLKLGTGFGLNAEAEVKPGGKPICGTPENPGESDIMVEPKYDPRGAEDNVIDYANSSMLSFLLIFYVRDTRSI